MSHENPKCHGTTVKGKPCKNPVVGEDGYCPAHRPGEESRMAELGRKGGEAFARKLRGDGLDPEDLGPLETHQDAKRWLEVIGKAVLCDAITNKAAHAGTRAVEVWLKAEGERVTMTVVEDLKAEIERLKSELKGQPQLQTA